VAKAEEGVVEACIHAVEGAAAVASAAEAATPFLAVIPLLSILPKLLKEGGG
jgi:hypothetical protein